MEGSAARIDQRVEDADPLAAVVGDRPHLRDRGLGGEPPVVSRSTTQNVTSCSAMPWSSVP